jgi:hypothetical protein
MGITTFWTLTPDGAVGRLLVVEAAAVVAGGTVVAPSDWLGATPSPVTT